MYFSLALLTSALVGYVSAQTSGTNAFNVPPTGYLLHAGQAQTLTWSNLAGSTVTLMLRDGANGDLNSGTTIVANLKNTGSYTYTPPSDIVEGNSYTIEIINDQTPSEVNFTPQFDILSNVKASATVGGSTTVTATVSAATDSSIVTSTVTSTAALTTNTASTNTATTATTSGTTSSTDSATTTPTSSASEVVATSAPSGGAGSAVRVGGGILAAALGVAIIF